MPVTYRDLRDTAVLDAGAALVTTHGVAPVRVVPIPRVGAVRVARAPALSRPRVLTTAARLGLTVLIVVALVTAASVATGRAAVPLQVLAAARTAAGFAAPTVAPVSRPAVPVPPLRVGTVMNLPVAAVGTDAQDQTTTVVEDIQARQQAERAAAAARAAAARAAAARAAAQRAAAQRAAAQRAAAQAAAQQAAQQQAAQQRAAQQRAAQQEAARQAAARKAANRAAAEKAAAAAQDDTAGAAGDQQEAVRSPSGTTGRGVQGGRSARPASAGVPDADDSGGSGSGSGSSGSSGSSSSASGGGGSSGSGSGSAGSDSDSGSGSGGGSSGSGSVSET